MAEDHMLAAIARTGRFLAMHPLTRDQRLRTFARFAHWQIESRLRDEVVVPWIGGTRLAVRRGMAGATGNIYAGLHEWPDMAFVLHFLQAGDLFADIGANVGTYTVLASGVRGSRTIAFEPAQETVPALRRNVAINGVDHLVIVRACALGAAPDETRFTVGYGPENRSSVDGACAVPVETLDGALAGAVPILIKLDVEGSELQVAAGAARTLAGARLLAVLSECRRFELAALLERQGFSRFAYEPLTRSLVAGDGNGANALWLRDEAQVARRLRAAPSFSVFGHRI
jgi:FkbM family methyltransferase